ncbi:MAG: proline dehydrogenase family protein [Bacteroidota bacterium]|nr:proline dehydrogenase family protein [Bacteroidota bacterium]
MNISFDNTELAFAYKSDKELKKAKFLFSSMGIDWLVKLGTRITPWAIKVGLPVNGIIRKTMFSQFVGGESLEQTKSVVNKLSEYGVQVILDYGVEAKEGEENFEHAAKEFIRVIDYAATQPTINFMSIKLTGFARFELLEKLNKSSNIESAIAGEINIDILNNDEKQEWHRVVSRLTHICEAAQKNNIGVLVDAEETWIQHPVDAITMQMMEKYNRGRMIVYNTIQLYRKDRLQFLKDSVESARRKNFMWGAKLVRGAYMEKERKRAAEKNYSSPIQPDKQTTDKDYNAAIEFCIQHLNDLQFFVASHNEYSNMYATQLLQENNLSFNHPHIHFSQLFGMSDNISFNLAKAACSVSKLLPFGPLKDVIPYLMRRAQENSSVSGQTGRELQLIKKELKRRSENNK